MIESLVTPGRLRITRSVVTTSAIVSGWSPAPTDGTSNGIGVVVVAIVELAGDSSVVGEDPMSRVGRVNRCRRIGRRAGSQ